jgi:hypothetical protein
MKVKSEWDENRFPFNASISVEWKMNSRNVFARKRLIIINFMCCYSLREQKHLYCLCLWQLSEYIGENCTTIWFIHTFAELQNHPCSNRFECVFDVIYLFFCIRGDCKHANACIVEHKQ